MIDFLFIIFISKNIAQTHASIEGSHIVHESTNNNGSGQGSTAVNHNLGNTGIKAMVITEDVLHKGDGKAYTSIPVLSNALQTGTAKSVDQQIVELQVSALESEKESLDASRRASLQKTKLKQVEAEEKRAKANLLKKKKAEIDAILHSPKEELVKPIMPIIAVTPHTFGFAVHDEYELKRLNDLRQAALVEGDMQKKNALLHERPNNESPMESLVEDPELVKKFYENAPVNKTSAVVDPSKGRFSIINDNKKASSAGGAHSVSHGHGTGLVSGSTSSGHIHVPISTSDGEHLGDYHSGEIPRYEGWF
ncbi:putative SP-containing protein [Vairimorpha necatrix]|uniref:SP-containing protein n=1 Tax=Vairimorpha necatrix TaxID=6039 RepID=A0AAX4JF51_9MICR